MDKQEQKELRPGWLERWAKRDARKDRRLDLVELFEPSRQNYLRYSRIVWETFGNDDR